jgi:hypothetical protein
MDDELDPQVERAVVLLRRALGAKTEVAFSEAWSAFLEEAEEVSREKLWAYRRQRLEEEERLEEEDRKAKWKSG